MSISQILKGIFGEIEPYGDTTIDDIRFDNIQNYYEALSFIISHLKEASKFKDDDRFSVKRIGQECYDILKEFDIPTNED